MRFDTSGARIRFRPRIRRAVRRAARATAAAAGALTATLLAPGSSPAQDLAGTAGAGIQYQAYSFGAADSVGIGSLSLLTIPVAGRARLPGPVTLEIGTHWARGVLERPDGSTTEIDGLTDTKVKASVRVIQDFVTISAVGILPTGRSTYSFEELDVAGAIASDLLPFPISNWGSGGGGGIRTTAARRIGRVGLGISLGYFTFGEFDPVRGEDVSYRPGDSFEMRVAADAPVGRASKIGLQGSLRLYGDDTRENVNLFRAGDRYEVLGSYAFPVADRGAGFLYAGVHHRSQGAFLDDLRARAAQDLLLFGVGGRFRVRQVLILPAVDARILRSGAGEEDGFNVGVGGSAEWPAGAVTLVPTLRMHFGNVAIREGTDSGFTGIEVGLGVRLGRQGP